MTVETAAVMSGHKRKLGEGKLFWLTAYLQLGNYILNTLNLSDIYNMLYETSQPQVIRNPCPAPVCASSFPQSSSSVSSTFLECHDHATPRGARPALQAHCQQEWVEIGLRSQFLLRQLSRLCTLNTGSSTFGFCLSRLLPSCSKIQQ